MGLLAIFFTTTSVFAENSDPKVVVVGAGLAGLTAAYRLQKEGIDVDLYEARNRVGGRVLTVCVKGTIAELGGQNITDGGEAINLHRLIDEFGFELTQSRVNLDHSYFDGCDLIPIKQLVRDKQFNPKMVRDQLNELILHSHNMKEILDGLFEETDPLYKFFSVRLASYEGAPPEKLSTFYAETLFHMLLGGICSAHPANGEEDHYIDLISIKGGNSLLPEKIASIIGSRLHLNQPLKQVTKAEDGSFALTFQDGQKVKADIVVLAIPCSVYETIVFEDNVIGLERLEAIKNVQYGTNAKILVPFSATPAKRAGLINDQVVSFFHRNLLVIYYTGETSRFSRDTILSRYTPVWPMIEKGFGAIGPSFIAPAFAEDRPFAIYDSPVGYSWPNDPYAKGSYSYIAPGQEAPLTAITEEQGELFKTLFAPIDERLYFAGEHASILMDVPGTMEAACESGERVARTIFKLLKSCHPLDGPIRSQ